MWSSYSSGAAAVPPSAPSTMMKSGVVPTSIIALHMASTSTREPTHSLNPAGLPPDSSRISAMNSISSTGVRNTEWADGLTHFSPCGTSRIRAISALTLAAGRTPPMPGLAPWLSLSETILTWSLDALLANSPRSKWPSLVRVEK